MAIMFGNGQVQTYDGTEAYIMKTEQFTSSGDTLPTAADAIADATTVGGWDQGFTGPDGNRYLKINPKFFDASGNIVSDTTSTDDGTVAWEADQKYFCSYDLLASGAVIEISANSFPGTYYVTGDTYARSEVTGDDEFFQFIIPKAKVQSENTITLEAEGDPSVSILNAEVKAA